MCLDISCVCAKISVVRRNTERGNKMILHKITCRDGTTYEISDNAASKRPFSEPFSWRAMTE
jgi:hypothetical protein